MHRITVTKIYSTGAFVLLLMLFSVASFAVVENSIAFLLPVSAEIPELQIADEPQYFAGDDLFLLINGGAEVYQEYGFVSVTAQEYKTAKGEFITLEIYEMVDSSAAYGIYSFKTGKTGRTLRIGNDCLYEGYYLNFWKGNYLVTVTTSNAKKGDLNTLTKLAGIVAEKISETGEYPSMLEMNEHSRKFRHLYFRGPLGLSNYTVIDYSTVLQIEEGLLTEVDFGFFIELSYSKEQTAREVRQSLMKHLKSSENWNWIPEPHALTYIAYNDKYRISIMQNGSKLLISMIESRNRK